MSEKTTIEWTATVHADGTVTPGATWNPVVGCDQISPGCAHCYAKTAHDRRHQGYLAGKALPVQYAEPFEVVQLKPDRLEQPLHWKKPRRVFVNSLSDLFHEAVPDVFIERVFSVMALAERHVFQVLTKRPDRMLAWFRARRFDVKGYAILQTERAGECVYAHAWPLPNVWLGVSVENQHFADERIPLLLQTPAAVRFISAEPLLGPVDLTGLFAAHFENPSADASLDWVIVGGESGPGARPMDLAWARSIVQQCQAARVACFVKQLGANAEDAQKCGDCDPCIAGERCYQQYYVWLGLRDKKGGDPSEWPTDLRVRQFPDGAPQIGSVDAVKGSGERTRDRGRDPRSRAR